MPRCAHEQNAASLAEPVMAEPGSAPAEAARRLIHPTSVNGYRVHHLIGSGGFGTVVAATRERDGLAVAIKTVYRNDPISCRRLVREAEALRAIGAPFVPEVYETGTLPDGSPFLVLELLTWSLLDTKLGEPMSRTVFGQVANAILTALEAAHGCGYVHRDLKPENIFIDESQKAARLIDFGLAKSLHDKAGVGEETLAGMVLGTPIYMAPEQCEGRSNVDQRADIYAAGVVLYEMLTARPPFFGKPAEVRAAHVSHRPPPPSHVAPVPPMFDEVILRCLAKEPERRFATAGALRKALTAAMEQGDLPVRSPVPGHRRVLISQQPVLVGLVFFHAAVGTSVVLEWLASMGGLLVHVDGARCVAAFGLSAGGNPIERACDSARALIEQGLAPCAVVERERVRSHQSPDGTRRLMTGAFCRNELYPQLGDPHGVLVTERAAEGLARARTALLPGRNGLLQLVRPGEPDETGEPGKADSPLRLEPEQSTSIGREKEMAALLASVRMAMDERMPTIATVIAEIGHGKSHLAAAVSAAVRGSMPEARVIELRAREPLGVEHDALVQNLVGAALPLPETPPADHGQSLVAEHLGARVAEEVWPAVALALGWLPADAPQVRRLSAAPSALRSAAAQAAGEALRRMARTGPVCVIVDDAHFADETTLDALEYATLAEAQVPLWVCVLAEPIFGRARPSWASRAARVLQLRLSALEPEAAATLCRWLLQPAKSVPEQIIQRLVEWTRGNPLLLVELARSAKRQGLIRRHTRGDAWYLATDELERLPELPQVEWLAERELAALSPPQAATARLVALLGAEFTVREVESVLHELELDGLGEAFPLDAWVGVSGLLGQGLLVARHDGHFEFRHVHIREQVVRSTPAELRTQIHRAAFRYFRDAADMKTRYRTQRLAWHAEHCGLLAAAAATYLHLAERAQARHEYLEAELFYSRVLELMDQMPRSYSLARMEALNGRGLMHYRLSRFADALRDLEQAMLIAEHHEDTEAQLKLYLDQATVLDWTQDFQRSRAMVEAARTLAPLVGSELIAARLELGLGRACFRSREIDHAEALLRRAVDRAEPLGDQGYETLVISLMMLGTILSLSGKVREATAMFDRAVELSEERGDKLHLAAALNNRRDLWMAQKDVQRAARDGLRAQRIGREIGQSLVEYATAYNLAELYYYAGDLEAAWPHVERAVELEESANPRPWAQILYARMLAFAGRQDQARAVLARIHETQEEARRRLNDDGFLDEHDELLCAIVELCTRQAGPDEWLPVRGRAETMLRPLELAELLELMAQATAARGDRLAAAELMREALAAALQASHLIEERVRAGLTALESTA